MTEELSLKIDHELAEFKKQLIEKYSPKPQFEVGKWYKNTHNQRNNLYCFQGQNKNHYGFNLSNNWTTGYGSININEHPETQIPATPEEVKQALVKEAERRGFKEGVFFRSINECDKGQVRPYKPYHKVNSIEFTYHPEDDQLYCISGMSTENGRFCSNPSIYQQGQWAEIIKEEVIKIGGYEVTIHGCSLSAFYTRIDGHKFTKEFWQAAKVVAEHTKAAVWVGCGAKQFSNGSKWLAPLETINSILKKL